MGDTTQATGSLEPTHPNVPGEGPSLRPLGAGPAAASPGPSARRPASRVPLPAALPVSRQVQPRQRPAPESGEPRTKPRSSARTSATTITYGAPSTLPRPGSARRGGRPDTVRRESGGLVRSDRRIGSDDDRCPVRRDGRMVQEPLRPPPAASPVPRPPEDGRQQLTTALRTATPDTLATAVREAFPEPHITVDTVTHAGVPVAAVGVPAERDCLLLIRTPSGDIESPGFTKIWLEPDEPGCKTQAIAVTPR